MRWQRSTVALGISLALTAAASPTASGQSGVTIDPGSPTAKEYGIPLESVRRGAQPGTDLAARVHPGAATAEPFGAGITSPTGSRGTSRRAAPSRRSTRQKRDDGAATSSGPAISRSTAKLLEAATRQPGAPAGSTSTTL